MLQKQLQKLVTLVNLWYNCSNYNKNIRFIDFMFLSEQVLILSKNKSLILKIQNKKVNLILSLLFLNINEK